MEERERDIYKKEGLLKYRCNLVLKSALMVVGCDLPDILNKINHGPYMHDKSFPLLIQCYIL